MTIQRSNLFLFVLILILMLFTLNVRGEEWYIHYDRAMTAFQNKDWKLVIDELQACIEKEKEPRLKKRTTGIAFKEYLPYYYMGVAYYNLGNWGKASDMLKLSQEFAIIKEKPALYDDLTRKLDECSKKLSAVSVEQKKNTIIDIDNSALINGYITNGDRFAATGDWDSATREYTFAKNLIEKKGEKSSQIEDLDRKIKEIKRAERIKQVENLIKSNRSDEAYTLLLTLQQENPLDEQVKRLLKQMNDARFNTKTVQKEALEPSKGNSQDVLSNDTGSAIEKLLSMGNELRALGNFNEALDKYLTVLQIDSQDLSAKFCIDSLLIESINTGIHDYFNRITGNGELFFRRAFRIISLQSSPSPNIEITVNRFLGVVCLEKYFKEEDTSGKYFKEAMKYIHRIYILDPGFNLEKEYFSPRIIEVFNKIRDRKK